MLHPSDVEEELRRLGATAAALGALGWRRRVQIIGRVGRRLLDADDPLRGRALERLPEEAGLSPAQCDDLVTRMAIDWTPERLEALVHAEFDAPDVLDRWVEDGRAPEARALRALPIGAGVGVHICAGTVPGVAVTSLIRGLLVGSPVLLKPGAGDQVLPSLFVQGLQEAVADAGAATLSGACAVRYWRGGVDTAVEQTAIDGAGYVVAYGGVATMRDLRQRCPPEVPLIEYGHRISVAVVQPAPKGEEGENERRARACADAITAFDQRGCVSPQQVFVLGDAGSAEAMGDALARRLEANRRTRPPGPIDPSVAAEIHQLRGAIELRRLAGEPVRLWAGDELSWTMVLQPGVEFRRSCGGRTVDLTPVASFDELESALTPVGPYLQTVGVVGLDGAQELEIAERVGRMGASRVTPLERVAYPPAWWVHDGQGPLRPLVRWVERGYS